MHHHLTSTEVRGVPLSGVSPSLQEVLKTVGLPRGQDGALEILDVYIAKAISVVSPRR